MTLLSANASVSIDNHPRFWIFNLVMYVASNNVSIATINDSLSVEENERESVKTTVRYEYT